MKRLFFVVFGLFLAIVVALFVVTKVVPSETLLQWAVNAERSAAGLEHAVIDVRGRRFAYLHGGEGETLLLLHGFGSEKDHWIRMARHLTDQFYVIAPDIPGFGESGKSLDEHYDLSTQVARLAAFCDALGLKTFHVAGNSMGGYFAGHYALRYPERIETVWLLNPAGVAGAKKTDAFRATAGGEESPLIVDNVDEFKNLMNLMFTNPPFAPEFMLEAIAQRTVEAAPMLRHISSYLYKADGETLNFEVPLDEALTELDKPTLVLWGEDDQIVDASGATILRELMPNATAVVLPNVGHVPMLEAPKETADAFTTFLGGIGSRTEP